MGDPNDLLMVDGPDLNACWHIAFRRAEQIIGGRPYLTFISASTQPQGGLRAWYFYEPHP